MSTNIAEYPDFSVDEMLELWRSGSWDECRKRKQIINCDMYGWEYEVEGDWSQDGKYQHCTHVIKHEASGRCFEVSAARSGSYHSEWYYTFDNDPVEVRKEIVMQPVEKWIAV